MQAGRAPRQVHDINIGDGYELVRNPSQSDVARLIAAAQKSGGEPQLRYVTDAEGNVYVANANADVHSGMVAQMRERGARFDEYDRVGGSALHGFVTRETDGSFVYNDIGPDAAARGNRPLRELLGRNGPNAGPPRTPPRPRPPPRRTQ